jgi:hypothetical protein
VVVAALVVVAVSVVAVVGLLVVVDLLVVGEGAGAGGGPATATPIAGGVRVAAVGSAHTIDRRAVEREKWERRRALPRFARAD